MRRFKLAAILLAFSIVIPAIASVGALQFTEKPQFRAWDDTENGVLLMEGFDGNGALGEFDSAGVSTKYPKPTTDKDTGFATADSYYSKDNLPYAFAFYGDSTFLDATTVLSHVWYWNGSSAIAWTSDGSKKTGLRTKFAPFNPNTELYIYYLYGSQNVEEGGVIGCAVEFWDADLNLLSTEKVERTIGEGKAHATDGGQERPNGTFKSPEKTAYVTCLFYYDAGVAISGVAFDTFMMKLADSSVAINSADANATKCSAHKDADDAVAKIYWDAHPEKTEEPTDDKTDDTATKTGDEMIFAILALIISISLGGAIAVKKAR